MKRYKVIYSATFIQDIKDIFYYISTEIKAPGAAKEITKAILKSTKSLDLMPERHEILQTKLGRDIDSSIKQKLL